MSETIVIREGILPYSRMKISRYPCYKEVLGLGKERKGAILLDMACCCMNLETFCIQEKASDDI